MKKLILSTIYSFFIAFILSPNLFAGNTNDKNSTKINAAPVCIYNNGTNVDCSTIGVTPRPHRACCTTPSTACCAWGSSGAIVTQISPGVYKVVTPGLPNDTIFVFCTTCQ